MFWLLFFLFLAACLAAGMTGGLFPPDAWYRGLAKPRWTPPDWVFPVTWFTLYGCMSIAGARVAMADGSAVAMALWSLQIALNAIWTPAFFGLRNIRLGMGIVLALWVAVAACMVALWQVDLIAGLLFVPYLIWVTVASALNAAVWRMNPEAARTGVIKPQ